MRPESDGGLDRLASGCSDHQNALEYLRYVAEVERIVEPTVVVDKRNRNSHIVGDILCGGCAFGTLKKAFGRKANGISTRLAGTV